ncbi:hypothetical protein ACROYT_G011014 [Oculina patagonica]
MAAANEDWRSTAFRQKVISQIEEAVQRTRNPNVMMKNPVEMESQVYSKAKTRIDYLAYVARLLVYIRDIRPVHHFQHQQQEAEQEHPENTNTATNEDWHSTALRQRYISQIEEMSKRSNNPEVIASLNPGEIESEVFNSAESKADYLIAIRESLDELQEILFPVAGQANTSEDD